MLLTTLFSVYEQNCKVEANASHSNININCELEVEDGIVGSYWE
jgi:hypothetical protein